MTRRCCVGSEDDRRQRVHRGARSARASRRVDRHRDSRSGREFRQQGRGRGPELPGALRPGRRLPRTQRGWHVHWATPHAPGGRAHHLRRPPEPRARRARSGGRGGAFHRTRTTRNHLRRMAAPCAIPDIRIDEVLDGVGPSSVARKGPRNSLQGRSQRLGLAVTLLGDSHDVPRGHRALRTPLTLGAVRATSNNVQRRAREVPDARHNWAG